MYGQSILQGLSYLVLSVETFWHNPLLAHAHQSDLQGKSQVGLSSIMTAPHWHVVVDGTSGLPILWTGVGGAINTNHQTMISGIALQVSFFFYDVS